MKRVRSRWKAKIEEYAKRTGVLRKRYAAGKPWRNAQDMRFLGYATYDGLNGERNFAEALAWYKAAYEFEPTDSAAIGMHLCQRRLGRDQQAQATLTEHRQAHPPEKWEAAVIRYLLGEIDDARLLELTELGDAGKRSARVCEAYFYIGTLKLLAGDREAAVTCFKKSRDTGETTYLVHRSAIMELQRLAKQP